MTLRTIGTTIPAVFPVRRYDPGEVRDLGEIPLGRGHRVVALASGGYHVCAVLDDQRIKCWGWNNFGQLGLGDIDARGDEPGELGDALPAVDLTW